MASFSGITRPCVQYTCTYGFADHLHVPHGSPDNRYRTIGHSRSLAVALSVTLEQICKPFPVNLANAARQDVSLLDLQSAWGGLYAVPSAQMLGYSAIAGPQLCE